MSISKSDKFSFNIIEEEVVDCPNFKTNFFDIKDISQVIKEMEEVICNNSGGEEEEEEEEKASYEMSLRSTEFHSPVDVDKDELVASSDIDEIILINSLRKFNSNLEIENESKSPLFNIDLKAEKMEQQPALSHIFKGRLIKTSHFLKKNWKNNLANFKETRKRKILSKINFLQNDKINTFNCNIINNENRSYAPIKNNGQGAPFKRNSTEMKYKTLKIHDMLQPNQKNQSFYDVNGSFNDSSISLPACSFLNNNGLFSLHQNYSYSHIPVKKVQDLPNEFVNKNNLPFIPYTMTHPSQSLFNNNRDYLSNINNIIEMNKLNQRNVYK